MAGSGSARGGAAAGAGPSAPISVKYSISTGSPSSRRRKSSRARPVTGRPLRSVTCTSTLMTSTESSSSYGGAGVSDWAARTAPAQISRAPESEVTETLFIASAPGRPGGCRRPTAVCVPTGDPRRSNQPVGLRREDEVALGQAVDLVGPDLDDHLAPGEVEVGVVVLLLGQLAHAGGGVERLPEVREAELPLEVVLVDRPPVRV